MKNNYSIKTELSNLIENQIEAGNLIGTVVSLMLNNNIDILGLSPVAWAVRFEYNIDNQHPEQWFADHYFVDQTYGENASIQSLIDGKEENKVTTQDGKKPFDNQYYDKESPTIGSLIAEVKKETLHNDIMSSISNIKDLDLKNLLKSMKKELNPKKTKYSGKVNSNKSSMNR